MPSIIASLLAGGWLVYILFYALLHLTQDAREPPVIDASIPFLGPMIGMITHKTRFYSKLRDKFNLPIYTLRLPGARVYVVNATELIPVLQRQWRNISFTPILAKSGPAVMGMSTAGSKVLHQDMTSDDNFVVSFIPKISPVLAPGPSLDSMNRKAVEVMAASMHKISSNGTTTINFWEWTHHEMLMATTEAVYGPRNPYRQPEVEAAWNIFEPSYMTFALAPFKAFFARKTLRARETLAGAWLNYLENDGHKSASAFVRAVYEHSKQYGLSLEDIGRSEIGHSFAVIGTTAPTAWWLTYQIFSDAAVLADIRGELAGLVEESEDGELSINISLVRTECPILLSTFKETMRYRAIGTAVRMCLDDHLLDGRFLLKKGSMVIMSQMVHHTTRAVWGDDSGMFQHMRFVPTPGRKRPNPVAFRAFGGGHTLCPGRHFSSTEILAFAALMALQFDIIPTSGRWSEPTWKQTPVVASFQIPDEDIQVEVRPRYGNRPWRISCTSTGDRQLQIVSEDMGREEK